MKRNRSLALLLLVLPIFPFAAAAQPAIVRQHLRFQQVVDTVCGQDGNAQSVVAQCQQMVEAACGQDSKISEEQLIEFLCKATKKRIDLLPSDQRHKMMKEELKGQPEASLEGQQLEDAFLAVFPKQQAKLKVSNRLTSRDDRHENDLDERDLEVIETARLDPPLPPFLKDLLPPNVSMPVPPPPTPLQGKSLLQRLDEVTSIRQSFLDGQNVGKPATFTWTKFGRSDETLEQGRDRSKFEIRGAVTFEPKPFRELGRDETDAWRFAYNPVAVFEVDSSSEDKDKRNSLIHRVGLQSVLYHDLRSGHNFDLTIDYTTDRDYRSDLWGFTFQYTPNLFDAGLGQWWPRRDSFAHYIWRPFLGVVAIDVRDPGNIADLSNKKDFTNVFARVTTAILLGSRVKITPEAAWVRELRNDDKDHTAYGIAAQWLLDPQERMSILVSYEHGESAPTFKKKDIAKVALGLKL